jgi:hypothetical protein
MRDGVVLSSFRTPDPQSDITWEGNKAVLFPSYRRTDSKNTIVRCPVTGPCQRASGWMRADAEVSFPHMPQS